jgi:predicted nucleotidyltransferase
MSEPDVAAFLTAFAHWASQQSDVRAVALVGSHARGAAVEGSDVDLVIVARDPHAYLGERAWLDQFGHVERVQLEPHGKVTSLRVTYTGGLEVEYGLTDESWAAPPLDSTTRSVLSQGMRTLWDADGLLSAVQAIP